MAKRYDKDIKLYVVEDGKKTIKTSSGEVDVKVPRD